MKAIFLLILLALPAWSGGATPEQLAAQVIEARSHIQPDTSARKLGKISNILLSIAQDDASDESIRMSVAHGIASILVHPNVDVVDGMIRVADLYIQLEKLPLEPIWRAVWEIYQRRKAAPVGADLRSRGDYVFLARYGGVDIARALAREALDLNSPLDDDTRIDVLSNVGHIGEEADTLLSPYLSPGSDPRLRLGAAVALAHQYPVEAWAAILELRGLVPNPPEDLLVHALMAIDTPGANRYLVDLLGASATNLLAFARRFDESKHSQVAQEFVSFAVTTYALNSFVLAKSSSPSLWRHFEQELMRCFRNLDEDRAIRVQAVLMLIASGQGDLNREMAEEIIAEGFKELDGEFSGAAFYALFVLGDLDRARDLFRRMKENGKSPEWVPEWLLSLLGSMMYVDELQAFVDKLEAEFAEIEKSKVVPSIVTESSAPKSEVGPIPTVEKFDGLDLVSLSGETLAVLSGFRHAGALKPEFRPREHWMPLLALDPITPKEGITAAEQARIVGLKFGEIEKVLREYLNLSRDSQGDPRVQARLKREVRVWTRVAAVDLRKLNADHHYGRAAGEQIITFLMERWG